MLMNIDVTIGELYYIDQRGSINCGEISRVLVLVFVKLSASAAQRHEE